MSRILYAVLFVTAVPLGFVVAVATSAWGLLVALPLLAAAAAGLIRGGWAGPPLATAGVLVVAFALGAVALVVGGFATYAISVNAALCGGGLGAGIVSAVCGFGAYAYVGVWGFGSPRRLLWALPVAVLVGFAAHLGVSALLPGGHGFCET